MSTIWQNVKIGGGGYVTGIDASDDGATIVCRTDTFGGYVWEAGTTTWRQLLTSVAMPVAQRKPNRARGILELRVAPSSSSRLYMNFMGDIYRSSDRGGSWVETDLNWATVDDTSANNAARYMGQKMAVDPANPDVVYVGTPSSGVYRTFNAGVTWELISTGTIPACSTTYSGVFPGHPGICFDQTSGTTGDRTNIIYVPVYGTGVYKSADAGETWALMSGTPTSVRHGRVASDGYYYVANVSGTHANTIFRWNGSAWAAKGPTVRSTESLAIDPNDAARIISCHDNGSLQLSTDRGDTWATNTTFTREATDVPWLAWTSEVFMTVGDIIFDPVTADKIWFAQGIGMWTTDFVDSPASIVWTSANKGIENLTANVVICPPNGKPIAGSWDRPSFYVSNPETYPSTNGFANITAIRMCWDLDYATSDPEFIVGLDTWNTFDRSAYSTDGGQTWTEFAGDPASTTGVNGKYGGCVAASTPQNIVHVPSNNSQPYSTTDGGATWTERIISGVPRDGTGDITNGSPIITNLSFDTSNLTVGSNVVGAGRPISAIVSIDSSSQITLASNSTATTSGVALNFDSGWGFAYYNRHKCVAADRVAANTFYLFNYITQKLYKSTDSGANWTPMNASSVTGGTGGNSILRAVPGNEGHLFICGGLQGSASSSDPGTTKFRRSTDSGATWADVGGGTIREPLAFGFGAAAPGQSYPAIYFCGFLDGTYGWWRSIDDCVSWQNIGDFPANWLSTARSIDGDKETYGTVYAAISGASFVYRTEAMQSPPLVHLRHRRA